MRRKLQAFSRYRPRIVTLLLVTVTAAMLLLSNVTFDGGWVGQTHVYAKSYGWPLIWHRYVAADGRTVGWYYSASRLAVNSAMWMAMVAAPGLACEWLLRRYRPRLRWSLRTMLAAVGLAAAGCGWFASVRNRANSQDAAVAEMRRYIAGWYVPQMAVRRWGPQWLDLLGADRYRSTIVSLDLRYAVPLRAGNVDDERLLVCLARMPQLRALRLKADRITPAMADALGSMRRLQTLGIAADQLSTGAAAALGKLEQLQSLEIELKSNDEQIAHELLGGIGKLNCLETLSLSGIHADAQSIARLASLKNLKSLTLRTVRPTDEWLRGIGKMEQIERLQISYTKIRSEGLAYLANLKKLNALRLISVSPDELPLLSHLPPLPCLETLYLSEAGTVDDDLRLLAELPNLKALRIGDRHVREFRATLSIAGLAELARLESLEELEIDGDIEAAAGLEALLAVKRLKKLHLGPNPSRFGSQAGILLLDDGSELDVHDVDGFRRAVDALRQAKPGIIIDGGFLRTVSSFSRSDMLLFGNDRWPGLDHPGWLPASDSPWMTPLERKKFEDAGGWASFGSAVGPDARGRFVTVAF